MISFFWWTEGFFKYSSWLTIHDSILGIAAAALKNTMDIYNSQRINPYVCPCSPTTRQYFYLNLYMKKSKPNGQISIIFD